MHQRFIVARIEDWEKVTQAESGYIVTQNPPLIDNMLGDVINATGDFPNAIAKFNQHVINLNGFQLFNIKYKNCICLFNSITPLGNNHICHNLNRFWLYRG